MNRISKVKYFLLLLGIVFVLGGCGKEEINTEDLTTNNLNTEESTTDDISDGVNLKTNLDNAQDDKITITKHESTNDVGSLLNDKEVNNVYTISNPTNLVISDLVINNFSKDKIDPNIVALCEDLYISDNRVYNSPSEEFSYKSNKTKLLYGEYIDDSDYLYYAYLVLNTLGNKIYTKPQDDESQLIMFNNYNDLLRVCGLTGIELTKNDVKSKSIKNTTLVDRKNYEWYDEQFNIVSDWKNAICVVTYFIDDDWFWVAIPNVDSSSAERFIIDRDAPDANVYGEGRCLYIDIYSLYMNSDKGITQIKDIIGIDIPGCIVKGYDKIPSENIIELLKDDLYFNWIEVWNSINEPGFTEEQYNKYYKDEVRELFGTDEDIKRAAYETFAKYIGQEYIDYVLEYNKYSESDGNLYKNGELFMEAEEYKNYVKELVFIKYDNGRVYGNEIIRFIYYFKENDIAVLVQTKEFACSDSLNKSGTGIQEKGMALNYGALLTKDGKKSNGALNMPDYFCGIVDGDDIKISPSTNGSSQFITPTATSAYLVSYAETLTDGVSLCKDDIYYLGELHYTDGVVDHNDTYGISERNNSQYIDEDKKFSANLIKNGSGDIIGVFFKQLN